METRFMKCMRLAKGKKNAVPPPSEVRNILILLLN